MIHFIHRHICFYTYRHKQATEKLRAIIEHFIWWLNLRKQYITDQRIFGGVNPEGYVGTPIDVELLKYKVHKKGQAMDLTAIEYKLLLLLIKNSGNLKKNLKCLKYGCNKNSCV
mgnify:CR=1 FL=1